MLVPDSTSGTVKTIRISHLYFYVSAVLGICLLVILGVLWFNNSIASNKIQEVSKNLESTENKKTELIQINQQLKTENVTIEKEKENIKTYSQQKLDAINSKVEDFKVEVRNAEKELEQLKQDRAEIYKKIGKHEYSPFYHTANQIGLQSEEAAVVRLNYNQTESDPYLMLNSLNKKINDENYAQQKLVKDLITYEDFKVSFPNAWPVRGRITSEEGYRSNPFGGSSGEYHNGMDIAVPMGTPIKAAGSGVVVRAGEAGGYGNLVEIDHGYGIHSFYGHNSSLTVNAGQTVKKGDIIAKAGSTGRSTGSHCHFEVRVYDEVKDPRDFLEEAI